MEEATKSKKKMSATAIIGMVIGIITIALVQQFFFKAPTYEESMKRAAAELNKSAPTAVDEETRFDSAEVLPNNVFQYNYTLVNLVKDSIDVNVLDENLRSSIVSSVKTNPSLKLNRKQGTTFIYSYKDKNGELLLNIEVTPDLYKE
jgi:hypothetical protein